MSKISNKPSISLGTGKGALDVPYEWLEKLKTVQQTA